MLVIVNILIKRLVTYMCVKVHWAFIVVCALSCMYYILVEAIIKMNTKPPKGLKKANLLKMTKIYDKCLVYLRGKNIVYLKTSKIYRLQNLDFHQRSWWEVFERYPVLRMSQNRHVDTHLWWGAISSRQEHLHLHTVNHLQSPC